MENLIVNNDTITDEHYFIQEMRSVKRFFILDGHTESGEAIFRTKEGFEGVNAFSKEQAQSIVDYIGRKQLYIVNAKQKIKEQQDDEAFNNIYPKEIRDLSERHWTPFCVAKKAAEYLVQSPNTSVLDIGSGVGKFCMIGAMNTKGIFTGVEYRQDLCELSNKLMLEHGVKNLSYICENIVNIGFADYDAFYFFNSFQECVDDTAKIDDTKKVSEELYKVYTNYIIHELASKPIGTRLAANFAHNVKFPESYIKKEEHYGGTLIFWEKMS